MSVMQLKSMILISRPVNRDFQKVFKPITSKLDDVIDSNQVLRLPRKKRPLKKGEVPDYGIDIEDEVPDMNIGELFEQPVLPQQEKQLVPKPPHMKNLYKIFWKEKKRFMLILSTSLRNHNYHQNMMTTMR